MSHPNFIDLANKRFGKLLVLKRAKNTNRGQTRWKCRCDCGNTIITRSTNLRQGDTKSCGCSQKEIVQKQGLSNKLPDNQSAKNRLYDSYKKSAKNREIFFDLTQKQFESFLQQTCFYCGQVPTTLFNWDGRSNFLYNGIDRVDNSKGYVSENCKSCCSTCNFMKREMSKDCFLNHINQIYKFSLEK